MESTHNVYSSKSFSDSERLNTICVKGLAELRNLPLYEEFNEVIRMERVARDKNKVNEEILENLSLLLSKIRREIKDVTKEISEIKAPNRASSDIQSKSYAQTLINNAKIDFQNKPINIHERLKSAQEMGENEYIFEIKELYLNDKLTPDWEKHKVKNFIDELENKLGLVQLEERKMRLDAELNEVIEHYDLLQRSPAEFEARVDLSVRVAKVMYENGQFEGNSILLRG